MHSVSPLWQASLTLVLAAVALLYLLGCRGLPRGEFNVIPAWRKTGFLLGLVFIWAAVASPLSFSDERMLTGHMIQHLLLMTLAPPLIWLGDPALSFQYTIPAAVPLFRTGLLRRVGAVTGHPVFAWLSATCVLVAWHVPGLMEMGMRSQGWHLFEHGSFLVTGLLFWWPVVQPWPSSNRWPGWAMLLYLFSATLPCDVMAGLLVFSDRVVYPIYLCVPQQAGFSALEDQQCAAALMWTCVTVVFLVAGTILSTQLLSPVTRSQDEPASKFDSTLANVEVSR